MIGFFFFIGIFFDRPSFCKRAELCISFKNNDLQL